MGTMELMDLVGLWFELLAVSIRNAGEFAKHPQVRQAFFIKTPQ